MTVLMRTCGDGRLSSREWSIHSINALFVGNSDQLGFGVSFTSLIFACFDFLLSSILHFSSGFGFGVWFAVLTDTIFL